MRTYFICSVVNEIFLKGMFSLMAEPILAGPGREDTAMLAGSQSLKLKATPAAAGMAPRDTDGAGLTGTWPLAAAGVLWQSPPARGPPPKAVRISARVQVPGSGQAPHLPPAESSPPGRLHVPASPAEQPGRQDPGEQGWACSSPVSHPWQSTGQGSHQACLYSRRGSHSSIRGRSGVHGGETSGASLESLYHHRSLETHLLRRHSLQKSSALV